MRVKEGGDARVEVAPAAVAHDRWLDEDVDGFLNAMRRAKRTAIRRTCGRV